MDTQPFTITLRICQIKSDVRGINIIDFLMSGVSMSGCLVEWRFRVTRWHDGRRYVRSRTVPHRWTKQPPQILSCHCSRGKIEKLHSYRKQKKRKCEQTASIVSAPVYKNLNNSALVHTFVQMLYLSSFGKRSLLGAETDSVGFFYRFTITEWWRFNGLYGCKIFTLSWHAMSHRIRNVSSRCGFYFYTNRDLGILQPYSALFPFTGGHRTAN